MSLDGDVTSALLGQDALLKAFGQTPQKSPGTMTIPYRRSSQTRTCSPSSMSGYAKTADPKKFRTEEGDRTFGYRAQMLPAVCNVYLEVRDASKLRKAQQALAHLSCRLVCKLATHGIIAQIDAAVQATVVKSQY